MEIHQVLYTNLVQIVLSPGLAFFGLWKCDMYQELQSIDSVFAL